jgi:hypothetical protein
MYTMVDSSTTAWYILMAKAVQGTTGKYAEATTVVVYAYNMWY